MKNYLYLIFFIFTLSCASIDNSRVTGNAGEVYIKDNWGNIGPIKASTMANEHCQKHQKSAEFLKSVYDGWGNHFMQFKCK